MTDPTTYTAITIGPIIETLHLTSKPAGLWGASYLFSELSKQICERLPKDDIVSPYFESNERYGAGLFPDRVILKNTISLDCINEIITDAKKDVAKSFGIDETYLCSYLQVHAIQYETNCNPIRALSRFAAMMENEQHYTTTESTNWLLDVIEKKQEGDESACVNLKTCNIVTGLSEKWPLWADKPNDKIRNIAHIASNGMLSALDNETIISPWKKHRYYAVIQADGDSIGTHITSLRSDEEIAKFSRKCWEYSKQAADTVRNYGGVTIYAGGDDLLSIVPLQNEKDKTIFDLISDVRETFRENFDTVGSLSFGVAVRFYKFPLYEAIKSAQSLLFEKAKRVSGKNAIAFDLQKHSGMSIGLLFPCGSENCCLRELCKQITEVVNSSPKVEDIDNLLHSIMSHLRIYESVFLQAIQCRKIDQAFDNIFDEEFHKNHERIEGAKKLLTFCGDDRVHLLDEKKDETLSQLDTMLRLIKFYVEQGEEDERHG